jgi:hypothetical protein
MTRDYYTLQCVRLGALAAQPGSLTAPAARCDCPSALRCRGSHFTRVTTAVLRAAAGSWTPPSTRHPSRQPCRFAEPRPAVSRALCARLRLFGGGGRVAPCPATHHAPCGQRACRCRCWHRLPHQAFFDDVLDASVAELNFKAIVDGLGAVLFQYPFRCAECEPVRGVCWQASTGCHAAPACGQARPCRHMLRACRARRCHATPCRVPAYYALILRRCVRHALRVARVLRCTRVGVLVVAGTHAGAFTPGLPVCCAAAPRALSAVLPPRVQPDCAGGPGAAGRPRLQAAGARIPVSAGTHTHAHTTRITKAGPRGLQAPQVFAVCMHIAAPPDGCGCVRMRACVAACQVHCAAPADRPCA